ncbi:DoxX family protein [Pseudonocardia sp. TRM90224]|uniref:DoxX family protein n=1 Tax=Pseudonocardia sp. TRM90224 TaxID=2812678 RepID=UPI001E344306|nr:DoxX family protein [Pseudonocardia sp. TRM90224]
MTTNRTRRTAFWIITFVIVAELTAGSLWNLLTIGWIEIQLQHLGYPLFFAYILGVAQAAAAAAIIAPGLPVLKEWAYAGCFFLWSGAVVSHLVVGDGVRAWGPPLMFAVLAVASWALRPAGRRVGARPPVAGARAWIVPTGLLAVLFAVSYVTLPVAEVVMHGFAVELGWIDGPRP